MNINNQIIGADHPPYIIAEMSNNHMQDMDRAKAIIDAAMNAGADAVKIQTYDADSLTIDCDLDDFIIKDPLWAGQSYYQLYKNIAAPKSWTQELFRYARQQSVTLFSSPFDKEAVRILEEVNCPAYKIASFEAQDPELLGHVARTGKPVLVSTGVSNWSEIQETLLWLRQAGAQDLVFLHCISSYPASEADMNLNVLKRLATLPVITGLSDHSLGNTAVLGAVALGARVIEKHFTLQRSDGGPDAEFSLEPEEFKSMAVQARALFQALGSDRIIDAPSRQGNQHSRSVYCVKDIKSGERISADNVRVIRPGFGLKPKHLPDVIGKKARADIARGTAMSWELLE